VTKADESVLSRQTPAVTPPARVARFQPLRQPSAPLRNRIIAALRSAIETGVLVPGERLTEKELCDQLGVSRTSLREALRELQADGVLEYGSNRSLSVSRISDEIARNVYRIRATLEALVVEQFIESASEAQMRELSDAGERVVRAYRSGVLEDILTAKRAFYDCICVGAKNPIAFDMINRLLLRTSSLRRKSLSRRPRHNQSIAELKGLLAAIARRDKATAHRLALVHVQNSAHSALGEADQ
jgi:DNA-binding GntR family transcriptional regulator